MPFSTIRGNRSTSTPAVRNAQTPAIQPALPTDHVRPLLPFRIGVIGACRPLPTMIGTRTASADCWVRRTAHERPKSLLCRPNLATVRGSLGNHTSEHGRPSAATPPASALSNPAVSAPSAEASYHDPRRRAGMLVKEQHPAASEESARRAHRLELRRSPQMMDERLIQITSTGCRQASSASAKSASISETGHVSRASARAASRRASGDRSTPV
jgi:hypothetical protein